MSLATMLPILHDVVSVPDTTAPGQPSDTAGNSTVVVLLVVAAIVAVAVIALLVLRTRRSTT